MKINHVDSDFPLIIIDDYYSEEEISLIWQELNFILKPTAWHLGSDCESGSALDEFGVPLKSNYSLFLDHVFSDRNFSNILKVNRKLFNYWDDIISENNSWFFKNFNCIADFTMLSYYEDKDYYDFHRDDACITSLTWIYKTPRKFSGGDLYFEDERMIDVMNNRTVIFPSMMKHKVSCISMNTDDVNKKLGRFCITQFLHANNF